MSDEQTTSAYATEDGNHSRLEHLKTAHDHHHKHGTQLSPAITMSKATDDDIDVEAVSDSKMKVEAHSVRPPSSSPDSKNGSSDRVVQPKEYGAKSSPPAIIISKAVDDDNDVEVVEQSGDAQLLRSPPSCSSSSNQGVGSLSLNHHDKVVAPSTTGSLSGSSTSATQVLMAPDGGWGWVVVVGAFVNGLVAAGFTSLISVLYVEWTTFFDVGAGEMSWIGFLYPGMAGFVSIIIGNLWSVLGIRGTAIIGAILSVVGCLCGSFSTQPVHIALSIGVVSGIGVGLCYISSINMVAIYFHRRFGLANGFMFLGTSISQVGVPPLTRLLVSMYGWRGTLQVIGALMGNSIAAACLFRPLTVVAIESETGNTSRRQRLSLSQASSPALSLRGRKNRGYEVDDDDDGDGDVVEMEVLYELSTPIGTPVMHRRRKPGHHHGHMTDVDAAKVHESFRDISERFRLDVSENFQRDEINTSKTSKKCPETNANDIVERGTPSVPSDSNQNLQPICKHPLGDDAECTTTTIATTSEKSDKDRQSSSPIDNRVSLSGQREPKCSGVCRRLPNALADMFGVTLFYHEPLAILQNVSSIVVMIGTFVPVAHLVAMANDRGMEHGRAVTLLSILGVGGTIGRLLAGVLDDKQVIDPHRFMMLVNILVAIPIGLLPLLVDVFVHTAITIFVAGIGIGATVVLRVIQAKQVVAPSFISDAVRIVVMTTGVGMTVGAVLSGWIADMTGNYSTSFFVAADVLLIGAVINLLLSILAQRRRKKNDTVGELVEEKKLQRA